MLFRRRRRQKLMQTPWPAEWRQLLRRRVPLYGRLPSEEQARLEGLVQIFLAEKSFEGCAGQTVDDEVRLVIASQACLLLLGQSSGRFFGELGSILIYPKSFRVDREYHHDDGLVTEVREEFLGESWGHGALVFSWQDVAEDTANPDAGYNVVLHEMAHQLDEETGEADGLPILSDSRLERDWSRICRVEFTQLLAQVEGGEETFLDPYGAESPAEFFAVATETFFTIGDELKLEHPDLHELLVRYYGVDPATWSAVA
jgi:hypothetical protein